MNSPEFLAWGAIGLVFILSSIFLWKMSGKKKAVKDEKVEEPIKQIPESISAPPKGFDSELPIKFREVSEEPEPMKSVSKGKKGKFEDVEYYHNLSYRDLKELRDLGVEVKPRDQRTRKKIPLKNLSNEEAWRLFAESYQETVLPEYFKTRKGFQWLFSEIKPEQEKLICNYCKCTEGYFYRCQKCGQVFCEKHRKPKKHNCLIQ